MSLVTCRDAAPDLGLRDRPVDQSFRQFVLGHISLVAVPIPDGVPDGPEGVFVVAGIEPLAPVVPPVFCVPNDHRCHGRSRVAQTLGDNVRGDPRVPSHDFPSRFQFGVFRLRFHKELPQRQ